MPTTNRDASELTRRRKAKALYAYNSTNTAAVAAGTSVRREQPTFATLDIVTLRNQGGCFCTTDASANPYDFQAPGGCGCRG